MRAAEPGRRWTPTLVVGATILAFAGGLPLVDGWINPPPRFTGPNIGLESQGVRGTSTVSLVQSDGWQRTGQTPQSVSLRSGGSRLDVRLVSVATDTECEQARAAAARALAVELEVDGRGAESRLATDDGSPAILSGYSSALEDGLVFAVCAPGVAVVGVASGPAGARQNGLADVGEMLRSVRFR